MKTIILSLLLEFKLLIYDTLLGEFICLCSELSTHGSVQLDIVRLRMNDFENKYYYARSNFVQNFIEIRLNFKKYKENHFKAVSIKN